MVNPYKWDNRFMELAKVAASWSKDPHCKVGAVLVDPEMLGFAIGYNGLAAGIEDKPEILANKEVKNKLTVHAELNAILNAHRDLTGWELYCTKAPCIDCANAVIQAGITAVNCPEPEQDSSWFDENTTAIMMLDEAQIPVYFDRDGVFIQSAGKHIGLE